MLVPAAKVEDYLKSKGAPIKDFNQVGVEHFSKGDLNVTVFRGDVHGGWTERPSSAAMIADCVKVLCTRAEEAIPPR
jgi:hypothetical protein